MYVCMCVCSFVCVYMGVCLFIYVHESVYLTVHYCPAVRLCMFEAVCVVMCWSVLVYYLDATVRGHILLPHPRRSGLYNKQIAIGTSKSHHSTRARSPRR